VLLTQLTHPHPVTMSKIRNAIRKELKRRGWSVYRLEQEVKHVSTFSVNRFMAGKRDMTTEKVDEMFAILELEVVRKSKRSPKKATKKRGTK